MSTRSFFFLMIFLGSMTGLSTIPAPGLQLFSFIGLSGLFYIFDHPLFSKKIPLWMGCFGFGYFLISLHWIVFSLHVNWGLYYYLIPFALLGLPVFFGFYYALIFWVFPWHKSRKIRPLYFAMLWTVLEIIRAEFLTGFPWASLGTIWTTFLPIAQIASLIGPYGLSFFTVLWGIFPCIFLSPIYSVVQKKLYGIVVLITIGGTWIYGTYRLQIPTQYTEKTIRLVQPNSPQEFQWTQKKMARQLEEFVQLSNKPCMHKLQAVIWPEFSLPLALQVYPWMADFVRRSVPADGVLITNGFFYEREAFGYKAYNATLVFDDTLQLTEVYGKHRLLPFGEYIPFRSLIDGILPGQIHKMSGGMGDFAFGSGPKVLVLQNLPPILPMICHESIFSGAFHGEALHQAQWILALTNDGWFLNSLGPYQHLEIARMRAIETGLPLVRVANTGITAVIDPLGRTVIDIPYGEQRVIDVMLPRALESKTFYARHIGKDFYPVLARFFELVVFVLFLFKWYQQKKRKI